ncbi:RDD family protein [Magnetospirillum sp. UT-4]|uniref:RDD family protein n=1 Tax=Magnetospirillum sp. UT-4 TaxID=2681467 RepID=UPI00137E7252|nr:RDD family protein [Magnetospirillum sp. UT-4]CAA7618051.1 conserved membrane hypothetical protein [Magnetospirillum sp. UT-4]
MTDSRAVVTVAAPAPDWTDAWGHPEYYRGVTLRRIFAYLVDIVVVSVLAALVWTAFLILGLLSLGLLFPLQALAVALVPLAYHSLLIASPAAATIGMRLFRLRVRSLAPEVDGGSGRPTIFQAIIQTVAFYGSIALTASAILVVALFNARRRTLHDWLAGTVVVNDPEDGPRTA